LYNSNGTYPSDVSIFLIVSEPQRAVGEGLPNYRKVSEGSDSSHASKAYELSFQRCFEEADQDLPYWGRAIFILLALTATRMA